MVNLDATDNNFDTIIAPLLAKAISGDEKAFREIYDTIAGRMYGLCTRYAGNNYDANDIFQDGMVRLYKNLPLYAGTGSFEGWARSIFVNCCLTHLKKRGRFAMVPINEEIDVTAVELTGLDRLSNENLISIIQKMPDQFRTVVNLYLIEGYNHREISDILGINESTSRSSLSRAKLYLQKSIKQHNQPK